MSFLAIDRHARDCLRRELATTITCAGDLEVSSDGGPGRYFGQLRRRVQVTLHLLDDVGWLWGDDPREVYYLTAPAAEIRWWAQERLEGIDGALLDLAAEISEVRPGGRSPSALLLEEAREQTDLELDLRTVLLELIERLDQEGGDI